MDHKFISALAGISTNGKVEHLKITTGAINQKSYISWLRKLRQKCPENDLVLFIDNLAVHKTAAVMQAYSELDITPVFNSTFSPDYMPIEIIFSQVKLYYKQMRLNKLANGKEFEEKDLIRQSFNAIKSEIILKSIRRSLKLLKVFSD